MKNLEKLKVSDSNLNKEFLGKIIYMINRLFKNILTILQKMENN